MKLAIFLLISAYVFGQTSADTSQQCHQKDPNFNDCLKKLIERNFLVVMKEDPRLNISGTDLYFREPHVSTFSVEDLATGTVVFKNLHIENAGKFKVENVKINFDNLIFDVDIFFPKLSAKTEFKIDGKVLELLLHTAGSLEGRAADLRVHLKAQLKIIKRKGVQYFVVSDLEAHESIRDGSINVILEDPKQQPVINLIQDWFNQSPKENFELLDPIIRRESTLYYLPGVQNMLSVIHSDIILLS